MFSWITVCAWIQFDCISKYCVISNIYFRYVIKLHDFQQCLPMVLWLSCSISIWVVIFSIWNIFRIHFYPPFFSLKFIKCSDYISIIWKIHLSIGYILDSVVIYMKQLIKYMQDNSMIKSLIFHLSKIYSTKFQSKLL